MDHILRVREMVNGAGPSGNGTRIGNGSLRRSTSDSTAGFPKLNQGPEGGALNTPTGVPEIVLPTCSKWGVSAPSKALPWLYARQIVCSRFLSTSGLGMDPRGCSTDSFYHVVDATGMVSNPPFAVPVPVPLRRSGELLGIQYPQHRKLA